MIALEKDEGHKSPPARGGATKVERIKPLTHYLSSIRLGFHLALKKLL